MEILEREQYAIVRVQNDHVFLITVCVIDLFATIDLNIKHSMSHEKDLKLTGLLNNRNIPFYTRLYKNIKIKQK